MGKTLLLLVVGAGLIAVGANLLVDNGTLIAQALGVPESVIALTFVALGTSLPELVTAITSLAKGHGSLSLGNVIGANLFNLVLVNGVSVTLAPFSIPQTSEIAGFNASLVLDIPLMLGVMCLLTLPALVRGKLSRGQGIIGVRYSLHIRLHLQVTMDVVGVDKYHGLGGSAAACRRGRKHGQPVQHGDRHDKYQNGANGSPLVHCVFLLAYDAVIFAY